MSKPLKTTNKRIIKMLEKMRDRQAHASKPKLPKELRDTLDTEAQHALKEFLAEHKAKGSK